MLARISSFLKSYGIIDWIFAIAFFAASFCIDSKDFSDDFVPYFISDIDHPLKAKTDSKPYLLISVLVLGAFCVIFVSLVNYQNLSFIRILSCYFFSIGLAFLISSSLKIMVGRPRPDTKTLCGNDGSYSDCQATLCNSDLRKQFRSFPSTHATISMASGVFITNLMCEEWKSFSMVFALFKFLPILLALFVGISRIIDRAQHIDDVVMGFLIGFLVSSVMFRSLIDTLKKERKELKQAELSTVNSAAVNTYI